MAKFRLFLPLFLLLIFCLCFVSCGKDDVTTEITTEVTTTPPAVTTTTAVVTTTEAPITTEDPYLPGTPGLKFESGNDGTATVVGISDVTATQIRIPNYTPDGDRVIGIAYGAFGLNTVIESVSISGSVYTIANGAFFGCTSLKTVSFSEGLEIIEYAAFQNCTSLESVTLPASLNEIFPMAFSGCTSLRYLTVSENNKVFTAESNCLILKSERKVVLGCIGSKIPKDIVSIGEFAFYGAGFSELLMPDSIRVVENQAFAANAQLTTLVLSESLETLGDLAFGDCVLLNNVYLPASLTEIGKTPFRNCRAMTRLTVSEDNPAYYAENRCLVRKSDETLIQGFTGAVIPKSVKVIGEWAFAYMSAQEITIPDGVEIIEASAFSCCTLTAITLPKTLTAIAPNAFSYVGSLKVISFGGDKHTFDVLTAEVTLPDDISVTYGE